MLLTSNLKFLSSIYLSVELQSNVGYLNVGLTNMSPVPVGSLPSPKGPSLVITVIACIAVFTASTATCEMACIKVV